jgi:hypothetical protein
MTSVDNKAVWMRLALSLSGFLLFYHLFLFNRPFLSPATLGFGVFILALHLFLLLALKPAVGWQEKYPVLAVSSVSILLAFLGILRGDQFVASLLWLSVLGGTLITIYLLATSVFFLRSTSELILVPFRVSGNFIRLWWNLIILRKGLAEKAPTRMLSRMAAGGLIAAPILAILLVLFAAADPIYSSLLFRIFELNIIFPPRITTTVGWLLILGPTALMVIPETEDKRLLKFLEKNWATELMVAIGLVGLVLFSFLSVQIRYLFASVPETQLREFGVNTYSEYVNRGFYELILATIIVYTTIRLALVVFKASTEKHRNWLKIINLTTLSGLIVLVISVLRRLMLYQTFHGLTQARVLGLIFLVWLAVMIGILILRHFWRENWILIELTTLVATLIFLGLFNIDQFIAKNSPPTVNGKIDYVYLASSSPDGWIGWKDSYKWAETTVKKLRGKVEITAEDNTELIYAQQIIYALKVHISQSAKRQVSGNWHLWNDQYQTVYGQIGITLPTLDQLQSLLELSIEIEKQISAETQSQTAIDRAPAHPLTR